MPIRLQNRGDIGNNESHEPFFCEYLRSFGFEAKSASHEFLLLCLFCLALIRLSPLGIRHSGPTQYEHNLWERKIYVNTQHAPKQPYYTYNLCCLFPRHFLCSAFFRVFLSKETQAQKEKAECLNCRYMLMLCQRHTKSFMRSLSTVMPVAYIYSVCRTNTAYSHQEQSKWRRALTKKKNS